MAVSFTSYPGGKRHRPRTKKPIDLNNTSLGAGVVYVSYCGVRSYFWDRVFYQDRITEQEPNCKSCNASK